jgi:hypothetical protein
MESEPQFNLESEISVWRKQFQGSPFISDKLPELESHLRDSVESLQISGFSQADAFAIAIYRIGSANGLEAEFSKINSERRWMERVLWMLVGAAAITLCTQIAGLLPGSLSLLGILKPGVSWGVISVLQYVILGGLLVATYKAQKFAIWDFAINALIERPGRWCFLFFLGSLLVSLLNFGTLALPEIVKTWSHPAQSVVYHFPNLALNLLSFAMHALVLPLLIFSFIYLCFKPKSPVLMAG